MRAMTLAAALLLALAAATQVRAGARPKAADAPLGAEAVIPMTRQIDFVSTVNGRRYRIQIAMPGSPPPANGFGVLYVLDGDGYFGTYAGAVRLRAMAHEIDPVIVVGIGYPDAAGDFAVTLRRRQFDLTPTDADDETKAMPGPAGEPPPEFGGADAFLQVIETEIKPKVAAVAPVDAGHDVLFGHSLGGLFVLHALFRHPAAFRGYLALSPSIWWNHRSVLDGEKDFSRSITAHGAAPRVMLAVGGNEQQMPLPPYPPGLTREALEALVNRAAMVDNVRGLSDRLASLHGATGYQVHSMVFDGESHNSVAWRSVNAFLDFAFAPTAAK